MLLPNSAADAHQNCDFIYTFINLIILQQW